ALIDTDCNSVGGWVMELMGHIPAENEKIALGIFDITVLEVSDQTVKKVLVGIRGENPSVLK
ncbi:MAG: transporter associated domain-containing protein, partial [Oscillospiraceae bacterium]